MPGLASARDRAPGRLRRMVYGVFALGWRGGGRDWATYRVGYVLLAGLATPLVISVHSIVSLDFAFLFFAFLRWVPFVPLSEVKRLRIELREEAAESVGRTRRRAATAPRSPSSGARTRC